MILILLSFSLSYFFYDLYHVYRERSLMFLVHHSISISFILIFLYLDFSTIIITNLLISEFTTPFLNIWTIAKQKRYPIFNKINKFFTYFYIFCRGTILPIFTIYSTRIIYQSNTSLFFFNLLFSMGILLNVGNILWSRNLWNGYIKWERKQSDKKN